MMLDTLWTKLKIGAHMLDQPAVIHRVEKAMPLFYTLGSLALLGTDLYAAKTAEERKKVTLRDSIVLGATVIGTLVGARIMRHPHEAAIKPALQELTKRYDANVLQILSKPGEHLNYADLKAVVKGMWQQTKASLTQVTDAQKEKAGWETFWQDIHKRALPVNQEEESFKNRITHALKIFAGGFVSVLGGVLGGLAADGLTGGTQAHKANILKEAVFQFVANIALCAVGAILGLLAIQQLKVKNALLKTAMVFAGLCIGIFGGGHAANWLGPKFINPAVEWWTQPKTTGAQRTWADLKQRVQEAWAHKGDARKVEFADMILHLDDLPTGLAIAGMKVFEPLIQLFFAFSGYRAGIGYRNDQNSSPAETFSKAGQPHLERPVQPKAALPISRFPVEASPISFPRLTEMAFSANSQVQRPFPKVTPSSVSPVFATSKA